MIDNQSWIVVPITQPAKSSPPARSFERSPSRVPIQQGVNPMKLMSALLGASALSVAATFAAADGHVGERGRDGEVKIIYWQAPSIMNPYLSGVTKDLEAASLVIEPLARYNELGDMVPWLAEGVPTVENGGVSQDL